MAPIFSCGQCGSPSVRFASELTAQSIVSCERCETPLATFEEFKRLTTSVVLAEQPCPAPLRDGASFDPLARDTFDPHLVPSSPVLVIRRKGAA